MIHCRTVIFLVRVATQSIPKKGRKKSRRAGCLAGRDGLIHWKNAMLATSSFHYVSKNWAASVQFDSLTVLFSSTLLTLIFLYSIYNIYIIYRIIIFFQKRGTPKINCQTVKLYRLYRFTPLGTV